MSKKIFKPYQKPAGGWGALQSSLKTVLKEKGGAQTVKALFAMNQAEGFDCPGCAWPDPEKTSKIAEYCENGVKAIAAETTGKRVTPEFFEKHSLKDLLSKDDYWLESQGRLTSPMKIENGQSHYSPISWQHLFEELGEQLTKANPDDLIFYTSGRTSNEAAFLYQLLGRMLGSNHFPDCSNLCHESSGVALNESIGVGKGTVTLDDFDHADCIFVIGQNPGTNHPRMLIELQKAAQRGVPIISINPLKEKGLCEFIHPKQVSPMLLQKATKIANHFLQVKVGGDFALMKALCKGVIELDESNANNIIDHAFIDKHTAKFENFIEDIRSENWQDLISSCGIPKEQLDQIIQLYCEKNKVIICWAMGITQTPEAVATIQYIVNLLLLRGNIGKQGAGVCPVRGHSNVQGNRTVGITEKPKEDFLNRLGKCFDFSPPKNHGYDAVEAIHAMLHHQKYFMAMGGNFAKACPNTPETEKALKNCVLTAHVSTKLNRSHLIHGQSGYIIPTIGRSEIDLQNNIPQKVTVEDSMSMVHASQGKLKPISKNLHSEPSIVLHLLSACFPKQKKIWDNLLANYDLIRDKIEKVIPAFHQYNQKIKFPGGFRLKNTATAREWDTSNKKANFEIKKFIAKSIDSELLLLMTVRSHDQYNTTIYGLDDRYRGVYQTRKVIFLNAEDIKEKGLIENELVDLESHYPGEDVRKVHDFIVHAYDIPKGCAAAYFPETNPLVSIKETACKSNTPLSKYIPIIIKRKS